MPPRAKAQADSRPFVRGPGKTGCFSCPLGCFSSDFSRWEKQYTRAAAVVKATAPSFAVQRRCLEQDFSPAPVLVVELAPQESDDRAGIFGEGAASEVAQVAIASCPAPALVGYSYLVRCPAPLQKDPSPTIIGQCSPRLSQEIEARGVRVLVACGSVVFGALTGLTASPALLGKLVPSKFSGVMAVYAPAVALVGRILSDALTEQLAVSLQVACEYATGAKVLTEAADVSYSLVYTPRELRAWADKVIAEKSRLTYDIETGALSWLDERFPGLLCVSLASDAHQTPIVVPFAHKDSPVAGDQELQRCLASELKRLLCSPSVQLIGQNEKFDRKHIRHRLGFWPKRAKRDTYLTHVLLDERKGTHGLDALTYSYTEYGGYDKILNDYKAANPDADPEKGGSYSNIPGEILFKYAAMDAAMTLKVDAEMAKVEEYQDPAIQDYANHFMPALSQVLADAEYAGVKVDPAAVAALTAEWGKKTEESAAAIRNDPKVLEYIRDARLRFVEEETKALNARKKAPSGKVRKAALARIALKSSEIDFNPGSAAQLGSVFWDYYGLTPTVLTETGAKLISAEQKKYNEAQRALPGGKMQKRQFFIDAAIQRRAWKLFSVGSEVVADYARDGNPLAEALSQFRGESKIISAYLTPLRTHISPAGMVHSSFKIGGAETGRLASASPNFQQIPAGKGGGRMKTPFISRFGAEGLMLNVDYSQIELRVAAAMYRDEGMLTAYRNNEDLHTQTAQGVVSKLGISWDSLPPEEKARYRKMAKPFNFGVVYGALPPTIRAQLKKDKVYLELAQVEEMYEAFRAYRHQLMDGLEDTGRFLQEHGYVVSPLGTRRRIPDITSPDKAIQQRAIRQAGNFGIQNAAAHMTLLAICSIHAEMRARQYKSLFVANVHDSAVFDVHVSEALAVAELAKERMEYIQQRAKPFLPNADWSWLTCPLVADCEIGYNYGAAVPFDPTKMDGADGPLFKIGKSGGQELARKPATPDELVEAMQHEVSA